LIPNMSDPSLQSSPFTKEEAEWSVDYRSAICKPAALSDD